MKLAGIQYPEVGADNPLDLSLVVHLAEPLGQFLALIVVASLRCALLILYPDPRLRVSQPPCHSAGRHRPGATSP